MKRQLHLLVIDPQNDFCDLPPDWLPAGAAPALRPSTAIDGGQ